MHAVYLLLKIMNICNQIVLNTVEFHPFNLLLLEDETGIKDKFTLR